MADLTLLLDSSKTNQTSDDFEIFLNRPIELKGLPHEVGMTSLFTWFTWFNIHDVDYDNHRFRYFNSTIWETIIIPNGNYNAEQLEEAIHKGMKDNVDVTIDPISGEETYNINFSPNYSTLKMLMEVTAGYKVDLTLGKIHNLLGFDPIEVDLTQFSVKNTNITNSVNTMSIHCSLCNGGSYDNGNSSDILFTFVPSVPPGANISISPFRPIYLPIDRMDRIDRVKVRLTDQLNRKLSLNGENLTVNLHIRPRKLVDIGKYNNKY